MKKKPLSPRPWLFPRPILLVTTRDPNGRDNIITVSWAGVACSAPPMVTVALRSSRHSYAAVMATRELVVNIPTSKQHQAVELCGTVSGKETDKFARAGLGKLPASLVCAPLIAECPINLECKVRHVLPLGTHVLFVAEIVQAHVHHGLLGEDGQLDDRALDLMAWGSHEFLRMVAPRKHLLVPRVQ